MEVFNLISRWSVNRESSQSSAVTPFSALARGSAVLGRKTTLDQSPVKEASL